MASTDKIRILELRSCRGGGGGPEKTILFSALETDQSAFDVTIVYLKSKDDPEFDLDKRAQALGLTCFHTIDERFKFDVFAMRRLLQLIREKEIDILHAHCYKSDLYGVILRRFHRMKLMTTAHGPLATFQFFWASKNWRVRYMYDQLDLRILRFFEMVLMVSDTMRGIISRYGVDPRRLLHVRNAIDSAYFRKAESPDPAFRESLGIPADARVVGAVGRLNGEKDYPNLLGAAARLLPRHENLYFVIAGKGELEPELRRLALEMGIADRVKFLGHFHDVRRVFGLMDVYALSSTREGLPNTVLEAMAMEVPIVSTDVDGVKEAVTDEQDALLVPARDSARLAAAIERVLTDSVLSARLTANARARVTTEFSFARRMRLIEGIYRDLMAGRTPAG